MNLDLLRLDKVHGDPKIFDPGEGYVAVAWGIGEDAWIRGYVEQANLGDDHHHGN